MSAYNNNRSSSALDYNIYCLVEIPLLHDNQFTKHVVKWAPKLHGQMKPQTFDHMDPVPILGFRYEFKMRVIITVSIIEQLCAFPHTL